MVVICNKRTDDILYRTFIYSRTLDRKIRIKEISSILKKYHSNNKRFEKILDNFIREEKIKHLAEICDKSYRQNNCIKENDFKVYKGDIYELGDITKNIKGRKTFIEDRYFIKNSWLGKRFQCV